MSSKWNKLFPLDRWKCKTPTSSPFRVFEQYDVEIRRFMASFYASQKYTYSQLNKNGSNWTDRAKDCFYIITIDDNLSLKMWSNDYKIYNLWIRQNFILSTCSFFETYLDSVITESIQSAPSLTVNTKKCV